MAKQNRITRDDIAEKKVLELGRDYAKSLDPAINANERWLKSFEPIKANIMALDKLQGKFKATKGQKEFLQLKQQEEKLRKEAAQALKAEQQALAQYNKVKQEEQKIRKQAADAAKAEERAKQSVIDTDRKQLQLEAQTQRSKKRTTKLTEEEKLETRLLNRNKREMAVISSKLSTEYEKQATRLNRLKREYKDVALREGETSKEATKLRKQIQKLDTSLKKVDASVGEYQRNVGNYGSAWKGVGNILRTAAGAFGVFSAIEIGKQIFQQIKEIDALNKALKQVTETQELYAQAQNFIIGLGRETGVEINELQRSYTKFYASARTTNLTLQETQDIFRQTAKAGAVLGLSTDDVNGALRALEQMLSKGKVQAEEIRGQLGERLPGAFQILAKSMGLTTEELNKQLDLGQVIADEVLPGFAAELERTYSLDKVDKVETLNAAQGRLSNSWNEFLRSMESGEGVISKTLITLIEGLTKVVDLMKYLNDDGSVIGGEIYNKTLEEQAGKYSQIAKEQEKVIVKNETIGKGIVQIADYQKLQNRAQEQGRIAAMEIAKIDLENSSQYVKSKEEEVEALKNRNKELENYIDSENAKWFGSLGGIAEANRELEANDKEIKKINASLGAQRAIRDAANNFLKESIKLGKEEQEVLEDGRRTYADVLADIKAAQEELSDSTKEEAPAILDKITALNKEKEAWERRNKSVKEARDMAFELAKFELQQRIAAQEAIASDEEETFPERESAIRERANLEIELAKLTAAEKLEATKTFSQAELEAFRETGELTVEQVKKLTSEQLLIYRQFQAEKDKITGAKESDEDSLEIERLKVQAEMQKNLTERRLNDEIRAENEAFLQKKGIYAQTENAIEEHERRVAEIKRRYALQGLNSQVSAIEELLISEDISASERARYAKELSDLKRQISELDLEYFIDNNEKEVASEREKAEEILYISGELAAALTNLANSIFESRIQAIDEEIARNDEKYNRWLENENLSEEQRKEIEKQREKEREQLEKKKRKEQRKQAILNKAMAIADIAINTAVGIMKAFAQTGILGGPVAAAIIGAIGAVQAAAVIAQPIPKYAKGTDDHPGGFALVGEERPEVIEEPGKKPYVVSRPTVMDLPKGTRVTPSLEEYERLMRASVLASIDIENKKLNNFQSSQAFDDRNMIEEMRLLRRAYERNKPNVIVQMSKQDIDHELFRHKNINWS